MGGEGERERRRERSFACYPLRENTRREADVGEKNSILESGFPGVVLSTSEANHLQVDGTGLAKETHNHGDHQRRYAHIPQSWII